MAFMSLPAVMAKEDWPPAVPRRLDR